MAFIAEFAVQSRLMADAMAGAPDMVIQTEDRHLPRGGSPKFVFWASGGSFETFEAVLETDPTVEHIALLTEMRDRRLYRAILSREGERVLTYSIAAAWDITFLESVAEGGTFRVRAHVPSRDALSAYRDGCRERDIPFNLDRLYRLQDADTERYGLSEKQWDALRYALEAGHFEVPRGTTIVEMAADIGVSDQALSALIRRGLTNLLEETVEADPSI